jgi:hypothetical protein
VNGESGGEEKSVEFGSFQFSSSENPSKLDSDGVSSLSSPRGKHGHGHHSPSAGRGVGRGRGGVRGGRHGHHHRSGGGVSSGDEGTSVTTDDELIDQLHQPAGGSHSAHGMGGAHSLGDMDSFTTLSLDESLHVGGSAYHVPLDGHHEVEEEDKHEDDHHEEGTAPSEQS